MAKKRYSIGYVYFKCYPSLVKTDTMIMAALSKRANVVPLAIEDQLDFDKLKERVKDCSVVLNYNVWDPDVLESLELSKTIEELGIKVINSTRSFFYDEDKWMFYLKCLEHRIPTPKTYFISREAKHNAKAVKALLEKKPIVLKAVLSDGGKCVTKVNDYSSFLKKLKSILHKSPESPLIAQEFVPNGNRSYRVTLINNHVCQAIVKIGHSWKQTGWEKTEHYRTIKPTKELKRLCERAAKVFNMDICGIDLLYNSGKWYLIEANSCPGIDFINDDMPRIAELIADYAFSVCKKIKK